MHWGQALLLPVTGAFIGWLTNWMAVRMLFRPLRPVRVLGCTFQGVVPRRRYEIARLIGKVVEEELLPKKHLLDSLMTEKMAAEVVRAVEEVVRLRVMDRLPSWLPLYLRRAAAQILAEQVRRELPPMLHRLWYWLGEEVDRGLSLAGLVEERINGFSLEQVEKIITAVAAKELKHIEYLGGVLGFIIGLLQICVLWFFGSGRYL